MRTSSARHPQRLEPAQQGGERRRRRRGARRAVAPIERLGGDRGGDLEAGVVDVSGPSAWAAPPVRTSGTHTATRSTGASTRRPRCHTTARRHAGGRRHRGEHRRAGGEDRPVPERRRSRRRPSRPSSPTTFARGSSRCTRLAGSPGDARRGRARSPRARPARPGARSSAAIPKPSANTASVPAKPASTGRHARVVDPGEGVARRAARPPGRRAARRWSTNALSCATRSSPSGDEDANGETAVASPTATASASDREEPPTCS